MSVLDNQSKLNPTTAFYAALGSGGGGGGGPNPIVSTLFAEDGITSQGDVSINGANLVFPTGVIGSEATLAINTIAGYQNPIPGEGPFLLSVELDTTAGTVYGPLGVGSLELIGITSGPTVSPCRLTSDAQGSIVMLAASSIQATCPSTVNFNCSQFLVNGSPVGGGGGATVSTFTDLTVSNPTAAGATLNLRASDTNLYAINCVSSSVALAGMAIGLVGGRNQVYMDVAEAPQFFTSTIQGTTGVISLNPSGTEQIRIGGLGAPGDITINTVGGGLIKLNGPVQATSAPASISSLTVSSINGAAPGGGGSAITRTTVGTIATGNILGDGSAVIVTNNFTTLAGHLYSLSGWIFATASPNISSNASLALQIGNIDRAYQSAIPLWGYSAAGGLSFGNNIPVNMMWRADSGAVNNIVNAQMVDAQGTAVSTFINASNALLLVDYGAVA